MLKCLLLAAAALLAPVSAMAIPIEGTLAVYPYAHWGAYSPNITSWQGQTLPTYADGNIASFFATLPPITVFLQNYGQTIPLSWLGTNSNLSCGTNCLFSMTVPNNGFGWLNVSTIVDLGNQFVGTPTHYWSGTGILTLAGSGLDPTPGTFSMATQYGAYGAYDTWMAIQWTADPPHHAPGPVVGAGIPALAVAGLGLLWFARRRRSR